jgi:hypothetical protein
LTDLHVFKPEEETTLPVAHLKDDMGRACSTHGAKNNAYRVFGGKARRKETAKKAYMYS